MVVFASILRKISFFSYYIIKNALHAHFFAEKDNFNAKSKKKESLKCNYN